MPFEDLVEFFNLGGGHTGVLDGVRHLLLHVGVGLDGLSPAMTRPVIAAAKSHDSGLCVVEPRVHLDHSDF